MAVLAALLLVPALGLAQPRLQLPSPEASEPVAFGLMQGFPPATDKTVRLANVLTFPNARWAYQHMRELGPTTTVRPCRAFEPARLPANRREIRRAW